MRCASCHTDNAPNLAFCSNCGTMLTQPTAAPAPPKASGAGSIFVAVIAVLSTLALGSVIVFTALDDDPPPPTTTTTTSTVVTDQWKVAAEAWRDLSTSFVQSHTDLPFHNGDGIFAIATVDDFHGFTNPSGYIAGLLLLEWRDGEWTLFDEVPWREAGEDSIIEVLGDELVEHPVVLISATGETGSITWAPGETPRLSWAFRYIDGEVVNLIDGQPVSGYWPEVLLTDHSFDFLEYVNCDEGEEITVATGETTYFCDVETRSRLEILEDSSTRVTQEQIVNERPVQIYPNDLGIDDVLMTQPECDGSYITAVGASVSSHEARNRANIARLLRKYPDASYLRTDQTCGSLWPAADGAPIYVVYFGPFATKEEACDARSLGPRDAYVRPLSDSISHHTRIYC